MNKIDDFTIINQRPYPILFVNYHPTVGGGQIHLLTIIDGLNWSLFKPYVVCCNDGLFASVLKDRGITPVIIPFGKAKWRYWLITMRAMWQLYRYIKKMNFKLVHVSGLQEAKLAAWPCKWAKVPMVWVVAP